MAPVLKRGSPRWRAQLEAALAKVGSGLKVYQLSTIEALNETVLVPRVRTVVHRTLMTPLNDATVLLQTTTDSRSPKVAQIHARPTAAQIVWWIERANVQVRLTCTVSVLPEPSHPLARTFPREELGPRDKDWEAERLDAFEKVGPRIRATFCRPTPGSVLIDPDVAKEWPSDGLPGMGEVERPDSGLSDKVKAQVREAFKNFALVILEPREVDVVELEPKPNVRTRYVKVDAETWSEEGLVP